MFRASPSLESIFVQHREIKFCVAHNDERKRVEVVFSSLRFFPLLRTKHIKITSSIDSIQSQTVTVEFKKYWSQNDENCVLKQHFLSYHACTFDVLSFEFLYFLNGANFPSFHLTLFSFSLLFCALHSIYRRPFSVLSHNARDFQLISMHGLMTT